MNLFGTDGIRSRVGNWPISPEYLMDLGKAVAIWAKKKCDIPKIIIAHDTRISSHLLKSALTSGLLQYNLEVYDAEILPTPAVYNLVQNQKLFDFGIVITASHNLFYDNGIKIIACHKDRLDIHDEEEITNIFINKSFVQIDYSKLGKLFYKANLSKNYIEYLSKFFTSNFLEKLKIAIDCANGATSHIASEIFNYFGAETIIIQNEPNGININQDCGSTKPQHLQNFVMKNEIDIAFAFDGDGDRLTVINKYGEIKDGDDIMALLLNHPTYQSATLVSTIMTNCGLEYYLKNQGKKLIRTPVGDKYVAQTLIKENGLIGGEQSGHIILRDYLNSSDAIFVALRILETLIIKQHWLINEFKKFSQASINLLIDQKKDLHQEPFNSIIRHYEKITEGRIVVRYSGTEPLLRIMVETSTIDKSEKIANDLSKELQNAFKKLKDLNEKNKYSSQTL